MQHPVRGVPRINLLSTSVNKEFHDNPKEASQIVPTPRPVYVVRVAPPRPTGRRSRSGCSHPGACGLGLPPRRRRERPTPLCARWPSGWGPRWHSRASALGKTNGQGVSPSSTTRSPARSRTAGSAPGSDKAMTGCTGGAGRRGRHQRPQGR
jgi:hypothetical protein